MWKETSPEVYAVIWAKHKKDLSPHSSFTDSEGYMDGNPEILTEWGFKSSNNPLIKIVQTKENKEQKEWDVKFFIFCSMD